MQITADKISASFVVFVIHVHVQCARENVSKHASFEAFFFRCYCATKNVIMKICYLNMLSLYERTIFR